MMPDNPALYDAKVALLRLREATVWGIGFGSNNKLHVIVDMGTNISVLPRSINGFDIEYTEASSPVAYIAGQ